MRLKKLSFSCVLKNQPFFQAKKETLKKSILKNSTSIKQIQSKFKPLKGFMGSSLFTAETDIKYEGYIKIEKKRIKQFSKMENIKIPEKIKYEKITSLSAESVLKLASVRPETLGQASRIAGVRASDISILSVFIKHRKSCFT